MTANEAKVAFDLKRDAPYAAYFTDAQISSILNEALDKVIEIKVREYETDIKVLEELSPLVAYPAAGAPTTTTYHDKPADWKQPLSVKLKYSATLGLRKARIIREGDSSDVFEAPTSRHPGVRIRDKIFYEPASATEIETVYLKNYTPVNITASPNVALPLTNRKVQDLVIEEAVKIAAQITREPEFYSITDKEVKENP